MWQQTPRTLIQAPFSFFMQANFLYEQQLQREQDTVLKCMQTLQMQLGIEIHPLFETRRFLLSWYPPGPHVLFVGRITSKTLFSLGALDPYFFAPVYLDASLSMWSSASVPVICFTTLPLMETYS